MLVAGTVLQGRYEISGVLGQGGMGVVYLATDNRLGNLTVAVKEMDAAQVAPADRQWTIDAFRHEAQILARLNHPGIARVMDYFSQGDYSYLVMEHVAGETLAAALTRAPRGFDERQALAWAGALAGVLDYLHRQNPPIIFRDLKPGNVMVQPDGALKLIDFGIARLFKPGQTHDTVVLGTPGYAAPEQYGHGQCDARSDVYALGVVAHQLLTGYDPAQSPMRLPPLRQLRPDVSPQTEAAVAQALQLNPDLRFGSTPAFARALGAPLSGALPPPPVGPGRATVTNATPLVMPTRGAQERRGPAGWVWGALAVVVLAALLLLGWWLLGDRLTGGGGVVADATEAAPTALVTQIVTPTAGLAARETELAATVAAVGLRETEVALAVAMTTQSQQVASTATVQSQQQAAVAATATELAGQMAMQMTRAGEQAQVATAAVVNSALAAEATIEGFEYPSDEALAAVFATNGPGNDILISSSAANAVSGSYALEMRYTMNIGAVDYVGIEKNFGSLMSWLDYSSICLWLNNDDFQGHLVVQFREHNGETWKTEVPLANRTSGDVCIPLDESRFFLAEFSPTQNSTLDLEAIENIGFYLGAGGRDAGVLYLDNVRLTS